MFQLIKDDESFPYPLFRVSLVNMKKKSIKNGKEKCWVQKIIITIKKYKEEA